MKIIEKKDLLLKEVDVEKYAVCFCAPADFVIDRRYPFNESTVQKIFDRLKQENPNYYEEFEKEQQIQSDLYASEYGDLLNIGRIICLITKLNTYDTVDYGALTSSLVKLRNHVREENINKLAIHRFEENELDWTIVKDVIKECFEEDDIEIIVCN